MFALLENSGRIVSMSSKQYDEMIEENERFKKENKDLLQKNNTIGKALDKLAKETQTDPEGTISRLLLSCWCNSNE